MGCNDNQCVKMHTRYDNRNADFTMSAITWVLLGDEIPVKLAEA